MWPNEKKFAFTIIDDTDNGTIDNVGPVYDLLKECGLKTTKTVWVYPSKNHFTGGYLLDNEYLNWVKQLQTDGFEIALHNVGSGSFLRDEIVNGLEIFEQLIGNYPILHINHSSNPDNIYWGAKRYKIISWLIKLIYGEKRKYYGDEQNSPYFWGDECKKHIKYIRNHVFNGINTLKYDPIMPYRVKSKDQFSNYWFSSSDAHTVEEWNDLVTKENIDKLERENGCCIIYTHFASDFFKGGKLNQRFEESIRNISKRDGWFAPASNTLNYLQNARKNEYVPISHQIFLDIVWTTERVLKKVKYNR